MELVKTRRLLLVVQSQWNNLQSLRRSSDFRTFSKCSRVVGGGACGLYFRRVNYKHFVRHKTGYGTGPSARVCVPREESLEESSERYLRENNLKPGKHPGIFHLPKVSLPDKFQEAAQRILSNENVKILSENSETLKNQIWSRRLPMENAHFKEKAGKIEEQVRRQDEALLPFLSEEQSTRLQKRIENKVVKQLRQQVNHWEPIHYSREVALEYLLSRSAGEYACLSRIFNEMHKRDGQFQPKTLCDFGSGIGTVSWAARQYWGSSLREHLCADVSWEMNELAELLLRGGCKNNDHPIAGLFFRQHLPESYKIRYDLVVSAFSLMELPSAKDRLETIDKLWNKTENYLVIVEPGTIAGFRAVIEARNYILGLGVKRRKINGYVFSPCPSSLECPRFNFDEIPCNFEVKYRPLYPFHRDSCETTRFSYVVIRKGYQEDEEGESLSWPRLIQDPLIKTRHVICRMCTKSGEIKEVVLTKAKHTQHTRLIAKRSKWGDLIPLKFTPEGEAEDETRYPPPHFNELE